MMNIFFSKYQLEKEDSLNAKDFSTYQMGALIKIEDENKNWGVADICPWPNLGDLTLDEELKTKGPLFKNALKLAEEDLQARKSKKSLLTNKSIPNNLILPNGTSSLLGMQRVQVGLLKAFEVVKVKGSNQFDQLLQTLDFVGSKVQKIRLDFNGSLSADEFENFLQILPGPIKTNLEYIEDPTAWNAPLWKEWNQQVPLAVDFATDESTAFSHSSAWSFLIIKPSRKPAAELVATCQQMKKSFTLTSSMDHPVGLAHGLRQAQSLAQNTSGFLTLNLYKPTKFNDYFEVDGCRINFSTKALDDFGIGMTTALNGLNWTLL